MFLSALAQGAGYRLRWELVSPADMVQASILSLFRADNTALEGILRTILEPEPGQ
jgi:hypothetical protein